MYVGRAPLFLGIGLLLIPLGIVISVLQALVLGGFGLVGVDTTGEGAGALVLLVVAIGTTLTLLGLALVQAATACALVGIDAGEAIGPVDAYRHALTQVRPLLGAVGIAVGDLGRADGDGVLIPVAIWLAVRWALLAQVVELEGASARRRAPPQRRARPRPLAGASPRSSASAPCSRSPPARSSARS